MSGAALARALRRHGTTVALALLALVAAVVVLVLDRGAVTTTEAEQRKKNLFEAFRVDDITSVDVDNRGKVARLVRSAPNDAGQRAWEVETGGARYPAEERVVDQYLGALDLAVVERRVSPGSVDRAQLGLDAPRLTVAIAMGRYSYRLRLGGPAQQPEGAVYAEVEGHGVSVVTRELAAALDVEPEGFRVRALVPYAPGEIQALALDGEGGPRHLVRAREGAERGAGFRFDGSTQEGTVRASAAAMEALWGALGQLDADAFLSAAEAERAAAPRVTVTVTPRDATKKRAVIALSADCPGHPDDALAVMREPSPAAACVPQAALEGLTRPAAELVDRRLLGAHLDEVTEVKITSDGGTLELARKGPQWHLRAPDDRAVDAETGRGFLESLLDVEAARVIETPDRAALGLDRPRATVRLISVVPSGAVDGGDEERIEALAIGAEQGGMVPVERREDFAVLAVPKDRAEALFPSAVALRSLQIFDEPAQSVRALRVEGGGRAQRLERSDADGSFRLIEPKGEGLAADDGLAADLSKALTTLTAVRWVGAPGKPGEAASAFGLDRPRLVIEAEIREEGTGATSALRVALGAPAGAGSFARAGDDPAVFVAPASLEEAADRWLLRRAATQIDPEAIRKATLTAEGGRKVVIELIDGVFRIAGAAADPASTARAAAIRDALADLSAEGAVSIGAPEKAQGLDKPRLTITAEPMASGGKPIRVVLGAGDAFRGTSVVYARRDGVDATYAIAHAKVRPLFEAASLK